MSELRARCMELADSLEPFIVVHYDKDGSGYCRQIDILEAFAKQEQIKGMEAACQIVVDEKKKHRSISTGDMVCENIGEKISAEIRKLKEGG